MDTPSSPSRTPSFEALEAAAMMRLAAMVKDGDKKPSLEAMQITARLMAEKAHRGGLLAREEQGSVVPSVSKNTSPKEIPCGTCPVWTAIVQGRASITGSREEANEKAARRI